MGKLSDRVEGAFKDFDEDKDGYRLIKRLMNLADVRYQWHRNIVDQALRDEERRRTESGQRVACHI